MNAPKRRILLLATSVLVLAGVAASVGIVEQRTQREVAESAGWVDHTLQVEREFQVTLTLLDDTETGLRGFLLTENGAYLQPYDQGRAQVQSHLARLRTLTADNPSQQARLAHLESLVSSHLAVMERTVAAARAHRPEEALRIVQTDEGKILMDTIRVTVAEGLAEEAQLLTAREARFTTSVRRRSLVIVGLGVLILVTMATISWLLFRLDRVRTLVHLCEWSRSVEYEGEWITFEQYLQRRFNLQVTLGISPIEAARYVEAHGDPRR